MVIYITKYDPDRITRPLLARRACSGLKIYTIRRLLEYYNLWKLTAGADKISRRAIEPLLGLAMSLASRKAGDDVIVVLNPEGILSLKKLCSSARIILDYMDVMMNDEGKLNPAEKICVEECDGVIFWSRHLMNYVTRVCRVKKYTYIPYGASLELFNPAIINSLYSKEKFGVKGKVTISYSGGVWRPRGSSGELQGVMKLPKALSIVMKACRNAIFMLNSPLDYGFMKELKKHGVLEKTVWLKPLRFNHPLRQMFFSASDILVATSSRHPTVYYAERMKVFEYMASRRAIVADGSPGIRSVLGEYALYSRTNDPRELADLIIELIHDEEERRELADKVFDRFVENYEWRVLAPRYREFLLDLHEQ